MAEPQLTALCSLILSGVQTIATTYAENGTTYPSLDDPFTPSALDNDARVTDTASIVAAAATKLAMAVRVPHQVMTEFSWSVYSTATLGTLNELHVPEILGRAGPRGLHVSKIAEQAQTDAGKLVHMLRYLATRHIFREVSPDVFVNNRLSSLIDTGSTVEELHNDPLRKYSNVTHGVAGVLGQTMDHGCKGAAVFPEYMKTPFTASSQEPHGTPFNVAVNSGKPYFDWIEESGNKLALQRFGVLMTSVSGMGWTEPTLKAFDWATLPRGSVVVDVGGGVGNLTLALAKEHDHLKYVVEDREAVVPQGRAFCENELPDALKTGLIEYKAHDFFEAQPIRNAAVFMVRLVLHDWPSKYCQVMLSKQREAAQSTTKLIVTGHLMNYAYTTAGLFDHIEGSEVRDAPYPLMPNHGEVSLQSLGIHMLNLHNSRERTLGEYIDLAEESGWRLERVPRGAGPLSHLIFALA